MVLLPANKSDVQESILFRNCQQKEHEMQAATCWRQELYSVTEIPQLHSHTSPASNRDINYGDAAMQDTMQYKGTLFCNVNVTDSDVISSRGNLLRRCPLFSFM